MKFKVGNRVRVIKAIKTSEFEGNIEDIKKYIGKTAIINDIDPYYEFPYELLFDNPNSYDYVNLWREEELELVK